MQCRFGANDMVVNATYVKCTLKPRKVGAFEALTKVKARCFLIFRTRLVSSAMMPLPLPMTK